MSNKAKHFWIEPDELARKGLDFCSLAAQGFWLKVMRLMHDSDRYGYLCRDGKAISDDQLARRCGVDVQMLLTLLAELIDFDLLRRTADGILFSPELIAQAEWRSKEAKRKKDNRTKDKTGGKSPAPSPAPKDAQCPGNVPAMSRPNFKLETSFPSDEEKEKEGRLVNAQAHTPALEESPPADRPAVFLSHEEKRMTKKQFAEHLKVLFSHLDDVDFKTGECVGWYQRKFSRAPNRLEVKKWLSEEYEDVSADLTAKVPPDWKKAIENCDLCDSRGLISGEKGMQKCRHGER